MIDYGKRCLFIFNVELNPTTLANQAPQFTIVDDRGTVFAAQSITLGDDLRTVICDFLDFNSAHGICTAIYTPGTIVSMADKDVPYAEFEFLPTGLVPPIEDPPKYDYAYNTSTDGTDVYVVFDKPLTSPDVSSDYSCFTFTFNTREYAPDGPIVSKTVSAIACSYVSVIEHSFVLSGGTLTNTTIDSGKLILAEVST